MSDTIEDEKFVELNYKVVDDKTGDVLITVDYPLGYVHGVNDVMSEEDSYSEAGRRYVKEWYPAGLRTRIMPNGSILIINTRYLDL